MTRYALILASLLLAGLAAPGFAQSTDEPVAEPPAMDEELREAIANFGLLAGNAMQCADEAQQATIAETVFEGGNVLIEDHGSHKAFLLMIYYGVGSKETVDTAECEQILTDWQATVDEGAAAAQ
jgi:hypothetical protein